METTIQNEMESEIVKRLIKLPTFIYSVFLALSRQRWMSRGESGQSPGRCLESQPISGIPKIRVFFWGSP